MQSLGFKLYIRLKERKYKGRLKYMLFKNGTRDLVVVFSGFPSDNHPHYNYVRTLTNLKDKDKLFILDDFGYKGSYYWFENGMDTPMVLVKGLLQELITKYDNIFTMGTSKGGTAAIFYGLFFNVKEVFAGANQYYVKKYLDCPEFKNIYNAMMGSDNSSILNEIMPNIVKQNKNSTTVIHLLYSKSEHTYEDHIKGMIEDFDRNSIKYDECIENFSNHGDVGIFFIPYIKKQFNIQ